MAQGRVLPRRFVAGCSCGWRDVVDSREIAKDEVLTCPGCGKTTYEIPPKVRLNKTLISDNSPAYSLGVGEIGEYFFHADVYTFDSRPMVLSPGMQIIPSVAVWRVLRCLSKGEAEEV